MRAKQMSLQEGVNYWALEVLLGICYLYVEPPAFATYAKLTTSSPKTENCHCVLHRHDWNVYYLVYSLPTPHLPRSLLLPHSPFWHHTLLSGANTHPVWLTDKAVEGDLFISLLRLCMWKALDLDPHCRKLQKFHQSALTCPPFLSFLL